MYVLHYVGMFESFENSELPEGCRRQTFFIICDFDDFDCYGHAIVCSAPFVDTAVGAFA